MLTKREKEIYLDILNGLSYKEIEEKECITIATIKSHLRSIYKKYGIEKNAPNAKVKLIVTHYKNVIKRLLYEKVR